MNKNAWAAVALLLAVMPLTGMKLRLRKPWDERGTLDAGEWTYLFVAVVVLVLIVAALFPVLTGALGDYAANETIFGPILQIIVPLVIGAAILLGIVTVFLAKARGGM